MIRKNSLCWHAECISYGDGESSNRPTTKTPKGAEATFKTPRWLRIH